MQVKLVAATWLLLVAFSVHEAHGQLQCWVCENCPDPYEGTSQQLQNCPRDDSTTTTASPPGDTTLLTPPSIPSAEVTTGQGPTDAPPTPPIITPPTFPPGRRKRQVPNGYRCYRIQHNNIVRRGCVSFLDTDAVTCQSVNGGATPSECRICDWDGCNSASGLRVSLGALLVTVLLSVMLKH